MRYPGYIDQITQAEVHDAIVLSEKVVAWAETVVNPPPPASIAPP